MWIEKQLNGWQVRHLAHGSCVSWAGIARDRSTGSLRDHGDLRLELASRWVDEAPNVRRFVTDGVDVQRNDVLQHAHKSRKYTVDG
jgi:hypothetical protein